jgi:hypothetical protein
MLLWHNQPSEFILCKQSNSGNGVHHSTRISADMRKPEAIRVFIGWLASTWEQQTKWNSLGSEAAERRERERERLGEPVHIFDLTAWTMEVMILRYVTPCRLGAKVVPLQRTLPIAGHSKRVENTTFLKLAQLPSSGWGEKAEQVTPFVLCWTEWTKMYQWGLPGWLPRFKIIE